MPRSILAVFASILCLSATLAQAADPEELIKYRQNVMKTQGAHMSAIAAILRNQVDYGAHLGSHADGLAATALLVEDIFPEDSASGETDALPKIWEETEQFAAAVERLNTATSAFREAVADGGDVGAAFRDLGGACRNCHDEFRVQR